MVLLPVHPLERKTWALVARLPPELPPRLWAPPFVAAAVGLADPLRAALLRPADSDDPSWHSRVMGAEQRDARPVAAEPEDLARFLVERVNAGDVEGVVALYEPQAVLALPGERLAAGHDAIRRFYRQLLASGPRFEPGEQLPALQLGKLALTSTRLVGGGATAEIARRQPDGSWRWAVDRPNVRE